MGALGNLQNNFATEIVKDIILWIEKELHREITNADVSSYAGYSIWHMQRIFKMHTGLSLGKYIRMRKLTVAGQLLRTCHLPIADVFMCVGYYDPASFCRSFRMHYGMSPTAYRKLQQPLIIKELPPFVIWDQAS